MSPRFQVEMLLLLCVVLFILMMNLLVIALLLSLNVQRPQLEPSIGHSAVMVHHSISHSPIGSLSQSAGISVNVTSSTLMER